MENEKKVRLEIPWSLFVRLLAACGEPGQDEAITELNKVLNVKLNAMYDRALYTQYKQAGNEQARKDYLERRGIPASFRW